MVREVYRVHCDTDDRRHNRTAHSFREKERRWPGQDIG
jgi:hypothetical protein